MPIFYVFALSIFLSSCSIENDISYPETKKIEFSEEIFGYEIIDNYRWLEDFTSEESTKWVERQNVFSKNYLSNNKFQKLLKKDLDKIWTNETLSIPYEKSGKIFYYFNDGNLQQSILMVIDCPSCEPRVLIDPNTFSDDGTISLGGTSVSNDGSMIAYSISDGGSDWREWRIMNIDSGEVLADHIRWSKFSNATWENDDSGFYYQKYEEPDGEALKEINSIPSLMFHKIGTDQSDDILIYNNPNKPRWSWSINVVRDTNIKLLSISDGTDPRNRLYIQKSISSDFEPLISELKGAYNFIGNDKNLLFFYSTDDAPNGKIISLEVKEDTYEWKKVINETNESINSSNYINQKLVISYLSDTYTSVKFFDQSGSLLHKLNTQSKGTIRGFYGNKDTKSSYFSFTNFVTPNTIYKIDLENYDIDLFWQESISGFDQKKYDSSLIFYSSKDGTKIPLHISHQKNLKITKSTPILLYGYGGFDISLAPRFSKSYLAWMNQGGVVAVANLRGGGEYGEKWHKSGMLLNKQNVFDDFAYAAKYLHSNGFGSPSSTAILGGSNGGLLVAASMLQNPDLFRVAIPQVGVLDMLRFHKFTIGWAWTSDYGSPDEEVHFKNLLSYSPLHNIEKDKCYPTTLITTADRDDRVVPSHSFKFAAKLQDHQGCNNPILIRVEDRAGHGAGTPKDKRIKQISEIYGYALKVINN